MRCEEIREQLVETARGRELSSDLRKIVFAHAAACPACARRLALEQRLSGALSDLSIAGSGAPARLEQLIRQQLQVVSIRRATPMRWVWVSAAAAAVFIGALLVRTTVTQPSTNAPTPAVEVAKSAPAIAPVDAAATKSMREVKRTRAQRPSTAADADEFVPLPYAPELALEEPAEMVRVEMPRASLLALGLQGSAYPSDDRIQADVLLGMDGTPRAIRFAN